MYISIVIPVLNEATNIHPLCDRLISVIAPLTEKFEILFVDDGSQDGTLAEIARRRSMDSRIKALSLSRRFGHQHALTAGLDHAAGDGVICMDGDLQHPPELIPEMIRLWTAGYEIVFTRRQSTAGISWMKRTLSALFYPLFRTLCGIDLPIQGADFRLMDRRVVHALGEMRERTRFMRGLSSWVGYRTTHLSYDAPPRRAGKTKYSLFHMSRLAIDGLLSFSAVPLYLGVLLGMILSVFVLAYFVFVLYSRFVTHRVLPGWTSIALLISGTCSLQMILTGIVGLYLAKVYEETKHRPLYLIRERMGVEDRSVSPHG